MNYLNIAISIKVKVNFNILDNSVSITQYVLASVCHRHVSYTVRSCDLVEKSVFWSYFKFWSVWFHSKCCYDSAFVWIISLHHSFKISFFFNFFFTFYNFSLFNYMSPLPNQQPKFHCSSKSDRIHQCIDRVIRTVVQNVFLFDLNCKNHLIT